MTTSIVLLKKNRELLLNTLKYVQKKTKLGLKVLEDKHSISILLPEQNTGIRDVDSGESYNKYGAQLKFTQDLNAGIIVRNKKSRVERIGESEITEVMKIVSPQSLSRAVIFKVVIDFLEDVQQDWK